MNGKKREITILGSTGSIGRQALEVIRSHPDLFEVYALTAYANADLLIRQAVDFQPDAVVIGKEEFYLYVKEALKDHPIKVYTGQDALNFVVGASSVDMVLAAMVGYAGLAPTIEAIKASKPIALANKETLVVAGELIMGLSKEYNVPILPVDSEHSAIFQCLAGEVYHPIEKVILTASGGPFRSCTKEELQYATKEQALNHPTWNMGAKITIDSATMMNKGFEVIEAKWLFDLKKEQIDVVIHPESIIHSMVQFQDGSVKAQMGWPDMRLPIQYALGYPSRLSSDFRRLDFNLCSSLTFETIDPDKFKNLSLAYKVMHKGGSAPCVLNAANEVVIDLFLQDRISFLQMSDIIEFMLDEIPFMAHPTYNDYVAIDAMTREKTYQKVIN